MDKIKKFNVTSATGGIMQPQLAYRYRIAPQSPSNEANMIICRNAVSTEIDLINRRIASRIREPVTGEVVEALAYICRYLSAGLVVQALRGGSDPAMEENFQMDFPDARMVEHRCRYDYAMGDPVIHEVVWKFDLFSVHRPGAASGNDESKSP